MWLVKKTFFLSCLDFQWTVNTLSETCLTITNPLSSHNLRISGLKLICEMKSTDKKFGKLFDCHPVALDIPPKITIDVSLVVVPYTHGCIHIKGWCYRFFCWWFKFMTAVAVGGFCMLSASLKLQKEHTNVLFIFEYFCFENNTLPMLFGELLTI